MTPLISVPEAAKHLAIAEVTLRKMVRLRKVPVVRVGRRVLFDREALARFIARNSIEPQEASAGRVHAEG